MLDLVYARFDVIKRDLDSFTMLLATMNPLTSILFEWISPVPLLTGVMYVPLFRRRQKALMLF